MPLRDSPAPRSRQQLLTKIGYACCGVSLVSCTLSLCAYLGLPKERKKGLPRSMVNLAIADALLGITLMLNTPLLDGETGLAFEYTSQDVPRCGWTYFALLAAHQSTFVFTFVIAIQAHSSVTHDLPNNGRHNRRYATLITRTTDWVHQIVVPHQGKAWIGNLVWVAAAVYFDYHPEQLQFSFLHLGICEPKPSKLVIGSNMFFGTVLSLELFTILFLYLRVRAKSFESAGRAAEALRQCSLSFAGVYVFCLAPILYLAWWLGVKGSYPTFSLGVQVFFFSIVPLQGFLNSMAYFSNNLDIWSSILDDLRCYLCCCLPCDCSASAGGGLLCLCFGRRGAGAGARRRWSKDSEYSPKTFWSGRDGDKGGPTHQALLSPVERNRDPACGTGTGMGMGMGGRDESSSDDSEGGNGHGNGNGNRHGRGHAPTGHVVERGRTEGRHGHGEEDTGRVRRTSDAAEEQEWRHMHMRTVSDDVFENQAKLIARLQSSS